MQRSPLGTMAALTIVAALALSLMWLFSLRQVADTSAAEGAREVDDLLSRSLEPGTATRVTMAREGTGIDAPRSYVVRLRPSRAVAEHPEALAEVAQRAARIVASRVQGGRAEVRIHCVTELPGGGDLRSCFRRVTGDPTGPAAANGGWDLVPVRPPPPLPFERGPMVGASAREQGR